MSTTQKTASLLGGYPFRYGVAAADVHTSLAQHILADGFPMVLDLYDSHGAYYRDAVADKRYLDFFTCFASMPVGMNHPKMQDEAFIKYLGQVSLNKPSNSDVYTEEMATFVNTFFRIAVPDYFKYSFYIEGGALAVENALKAAFDWKVRKNFAKGYTHERGHLVMHFKQAFHGRTGYTLSLTNTDPNKTNYFPKFNDWPRITNPFVRFPMTEENLATVIEEEQQAIREMETAFFEHKDHIAAIILEPIQGEGGDNHFRPEFLKELRRLADENECLLIFDEVQTGVGITGTMWVHQQLEVIPDIMCFGKKMQVCGILATARLDEVPDNVFHVSSRINSTWGGGLTDMVRCTRYLEIIEEENLVANAAERGKEVIEHLHNLHRAHPDSVNNVRGRGLFCAFTMENPELRHEFIEETYKNGLLILPCGRQSVRFRPPLTLTSQQVNDGFEIIEHSLRTVKAKRHR